MRSKKFSAVNFMRKRRIEIEREDGGLSLEQHCAKTLKVLENDALWKHFKNRIIKPATAVHRSSAT